MLLPVSVRDPMLIDVVIETIAFVATILDVGCELTVTSIVVPASDDVSPLATAMLVVAGEVIDVLDIIIALVFAVGLSDVPIPGLNAVVFCDGDIDVAVVDGDGGGIDVSGGCIDDGSGGKFIEMRVDDVVAGDMARN